MARISSLAEEILYPLWDWRTDSWTLDADIDVGYHLSSCRRAVWEAGAREQTPAGTQERAVACAELATARYFLGDLPGARKDFETAHRLLQTRAANTEGNVGGNGVNTDAVVDSLRIGVGLVASLARGDSRTTLQTSTPEGALQALPRYDGPDDDLRFALTFYQAACLYRIGLIHLARKAVDAADDIDTNCPALRTALDNLRALLQLSNGDPKRARSLIKRIAEPAATTGLLPVVLRLNFGNAAAATETEDPVGARAAYSEVLEFTATDPRLAREHADAALNLTVINADDTDPSTTVTALYKLLEQLPPESELQSAHILRHLGEAYYREHEEDLADRAYTEASERYIDIGRIDAAADADRDAARQLETHGHREEALDRLVPAALIADIRRYALTGSDARKRWRESTSTAAMADAMRLANETGEHALLADLIVWVRTAGELDLLGDLPDETTRTGKPWWPSTANTVLRPGPWVVSSAPPALEKHIATACERYLRHWSDFHQGDAIVLQPTPEPKVPSSAMLNGDNVNIVNLTKNDATFAGKNNETVPVPQLGKPFLVPIDTLDKFIEYCGHLIPMSESSFDLEEGRRRLPERRDGVLYLVSQIAARMFPDRDDLVYPQPFDKVANRAPGISRLRGSTTTPVAGAGSL
ncbi:MAG: hypothetical protein LKI24_11035 [Acidipropionibacterium sp.]|jgi:tetratricopeptide (TPR) repeat protein|nr:hypothetical protein [Acidipropionibacterium sp.]